MIGQSLFAYVGIRLAIAFLRLICPASFAWVAAFAFYRSPPLSPWIALLAVPEVAFFFIARARTSVVQQRSAYIPDRLSKAERTELFYHCMQSPLRVLKWFRTTDPNFIHRENMIDWLLWAFFDVKSEAVEKEEIIDWRDEIEAYVAQIESILGRKFTPGRNPDATPMRLNIDPSGALHRPLLWYIIVAGLDLVTATVLYSNGFIHHSPQRWFAVFPSRPWSIFSHPSVSSHLPYWYRPHRSQTKKPLVFMHGIGVGLLPYTIWMREMDPEVGILLVETLPISTHMTGMSVLPRPVFLEEFYRITESLGIKEAVLASHSYGTILAAHILQSQRQERPSRLATRVTGYCFIDPIPFLLHYPDIIYNFLYRQPTHANEWLLWFFASVDPDIERALRRHFFWTENVLFRDDLIGENVAVVLSGEDQVVPSSEVWRYLTGRRSKKTEQAEDGGDGGPLDDEERWVNEKGDLEVLTYPHADHATIFHSRVKRDGVRQIIERLSRQ